jgi:hypothetical protein
MMARGAMPEPDSREPWFMCEAHREGDLIDRAVTAFEGSLEAALEERVRVGGTANAPAVPHTAAEVPR